MNKTKLFSSPLALIISALACQQALADNATPLQTTSPPDYQQGKHVYKSACAQCHNQGINGAPKLSDKTAWKDRLFEWYPLMNKHAGSGYLKMPAKGDHTLLTDQEVSNAVFYMTEKLKGRK